MAKPDSGDLSQDEPTGSCVTCARRDPHRGLVCDADRARLGLWLREIPDLFDDVQAEAEDVPATERSDVLRYPPGHPDAGALVPLAPELAPAAMVKAKASGGPLSGSRERQVPIVVDELDLTAPLRSVRLVGEDQIGYVSVASELDFWVEALREARARGEGRPDPDVRSLSLWLERRAEDACDHFDAVDEMFHTVRKVRGALMGVLGLFDPPVEYRPDVHCPSCDALTLFWSAQSDRFECGSCPRLLTRDDFDRWARLLVEDAKARKRAGT